MSETLVALSLLFCGLLAGGLVTVWRGFNASVPLLLIEPLVCGLFLLIGFKATSYLTCSPSFQASQWLLSSRMQALGLPIEGNVGMFTLGILAGILLAAWPRLRIRYDRAMGVKRSAPAKKAMAARMRNVTTSRIERGGWLKD